VGLDLIVGLQRRVLHVLSHPRHYAKALKSPFVGVVTSFGVPININFKNHIVYFVINYNKTINSRQQKANNKHTMALSLNDSNRKSRHGNDSLIDDINPPSTPTPTTTTTTSVSKHQQLSIVN